MKIVRVVDLSHEINAETQVYPGDPIPRLTVHSTIAKDGFNLLSLEMGSQTGTHVDAPFHFDDSTPKIDELPLDLFIGEARIVRVLGLKSRTPITWQMISHQVENLDGAHIVLFHTGWSEYFGTEDYFNHPFLEAEACQELLNLGITVFGLDAINIDETPDDTHPGVGFPVHHLIAKRNGVISENMTNLESIDFERPIVSLMPIKLQAADGAPVRAVAMQVEN